MIEKLIEKTRTDLNKLKKKTLENKMYLAVPPVPPLVLKRHMEFFCLSDTVMCHVITSLNLKSSVYRLQ